SASSSTTMIGRVSSMAVPPILWESGTMSPEPPGALRPFSGGGPRRGGGQLAVELLPELGDLLLEGVRQARALGGPERWKGKDAHLLERLPGAGMDLAPEGPKVVHALTHQQFPRVDAFEDVGEPRGDLPGLGPD